MASLSSPNEDETPSLCVQESRRLSIQRCIQSLTHASQCCHANCSVPACQKMKRVVHHTRACKGKGGCPACKQVIALCGYHAKHCQENPCPVPFCLIIKQQIQQQQIQKQQQIQQQQIQQQVMGHPMTATNTFAAPQQPPPSPTPGIPTRQPSTQSPPGGMASPGFPNVSGTQPPNVASQGKSTSLLPVVPPAQAPPAISAATHRIELEEEQIYWVNIEDEISVLPGMVNPTEGPVYSLPQMSMNVPRPGPVTPPIMQGMQPGQWSTAPMPQQSSMQQNIQHPVIEMTAAQQAVVRPQLQGVPQQQACNMSPSALQELMQTMKSLNSPQQQQQVLNILKSNPQLMSAFIKQRIAKYAANQPQQAPQQPPQQPGMHPQPGLQSMNPMQVGVQTPNVPQQQPGMSPQSQGINLMNSVHNASLAHNPQYREMLRRQIMQQQQGTAVMAGEIQAHGQCRQLPGGYPQSQTLQQHLPIPSAAMGQIQQMGQPELGTDGAPQSVQQALQLKQQMVSSGQPNSLNPQQPLLTGQPPSTHFLPGQQIATSLRNQVRSPAPVQSLHPQPQPPHSGPSSQVFMQHLSTPQFLQHSTQPSPGGMASLGSPNEDEMQSINPQESRQLSIRRHIQSLVHACQCRNCSLPSCQKIKRVMQHLNECQRKPVCSVCRNLIALCCYHARQCQENTCPVLFCLNIKHKLRQHRVQRIQLMRRRMVTRNTRTQGRAKG